MQIHHFVGIDISKNTLDVTMVNNGKIICYRQMANTAKEINTVILQMMEEHVASIEETLFCMEHTGMYSMILLRWLNSKGAKIWLESSQQIKWSSGRARGKNDKVDSERIALYAFKNHKNMILWKAPKPILDRIAALLHQRSRLLKAKKQLSGTFKEQKRFYEKGILKSIEKFATEPVKVLHAQIFAIEKEINNILKEDEKISHLYKIITSIDGVGPLTAAYVLVTTNEFLTISDPKKYSCYCGVVPFDHTSGTSVRKRSRVSHRANKTIKTLLHLAALSAIQLEGDIKDYYIRKVEEGKNKMSVLNAVRNKLVLRIFACVKQDRIFEKNYIYKKVA
ncbi:MAG TPA: IS110 family transposase [Puia sp.]|jgi:transposase|nr:IS110 family transposase [Puia sp.]